MAALELRSSGYIVRFGCGRYCSPRCRSCHTRSRREAEKIKERIEETCQDIKRGRLVVPSNVDVAEFIFSGGKLMTAIETARPYFLRQAIEDYFAELPKDAKEISTLKVERIHARHLLRLLPQSKGIGSFDFRVVQGYINERRQEVSTLGRDIQRTTIQKEIGTLRLIWKSAFKRRMVRCDFPKELDWPKDSEPKPFKPYSSLRTQASPDWSSLILTVDETEMVLEEIRKQEDCPFLFPLLSFVAYTGCRRSEVLSAMVEDIDFQRTRITIREKKRRKSRYSLSTRDVPLIPKLANILKTWLSNRNSDSKHLFIHQGKGPITPGIARHFFNRAIDNTSFPEIRGFHVFRHSFITNLASQGAGDAEIDKWVGHTTDETRMRYRHLLPMREQHLLEAMFGNASRAVVEVTS